MISKNGEKPFYLVPTVIAAAVLGVAMVLSGYFIANSLKGIRSGERYVTVKGLAEKDVMANLAVWTLKTRLSGDDLGAVHRQLKDNLQKIEKFLLENKIAKGEIETRGLRVVDRDAQEYGNNRNGGARYIVESTVVIRSNRVMVVERLVPEMPELLKEGVMLAEDNSCTPGPTYLFIGLNDIKPVMLESATKSARQAAEQFAVSSGSKVGGIRRANQGIFSIRSRDDVSESSEGVGCNPSTPYKSVRVVTTVSYYLEGGSIF